MHVLSIMKKEKVTDQVLTQLKAAHKRGELRPGDRLPGVSELAAKMNVGISSVREAVKMLESLGAVEARQGEGTFVCTTLKEGAANAFEIQFMLLPQTAEYLAQFRAMYETAYTRLAIDTATSEDLANIEATVLALEEKMSKQSPDAVVEAQDELVFHRSVLHCTHNPYIIKIGEVSLELFFEIANAKLAPLKLNEAAADHRSIYEAMQHKDFDNLQRILGQSFSAWYARFRA
jgi:GntR family transcriptional repressor for pyruvate dehydrogenase complex